MDRREKEIRQKLKEDFAHYAYKCLKISDKSGRLVKFRLNSAQEYLLTRIRDQEKRLGYVRLVVLKGRQQGISTFVQGFFYHLLSHRLGTQAFILTHEKKSTDYLFKMTKRYHENCPILVKPHEAGNSESRLFFDQLQSGYDVGTAGNKSVGRGGTLHLFHGSEVAQWPHAEEHAQGIMQSIAKLPGTYVILESTAKGMGNYFHQMWLNAEKGKHTDFEPVFIPWNWEPTYTREVPPEGFQISEEEIELKNLYDLTNEQILWRRYTIGDMKGDVNRFKEEYPFTPTEAFQASNEEGYIPNEIVVAARHAEDVDKIGPLYIGVDPAYKGKDKTAIVMRQGRVAFNLQFYEKLDNMQVAGKVKALIDKYNPDAVCIDTVGYGAGVGDRLKEMGYRSIIKSINSGTRAINHERFVNKKAEMWHLMREWLEDAPAQIPDNDVLHTDLCAPTYEHDSKNRLMMERKKDLKERGFNSTDAADALALTFGFLVRANNANMSMLSRKTVKI